MSGDATNLGAVASPQAGAAALTVFAAPATAAEFNTLGERLVPKACFKIEDLLFDFGSSFVRPDIGAHMPKLAELREQHKVQDVHPPLSIFGHADPVGDDDLNKRLSGRRAVAIYAMLVRDVDLWETLYTKNDGGDAWGTRSIQTMLSTVQDPIQVDGVAGSETTAAIKKFQGANGLAADGVAGPNTRKKLYLAYMDALCGPKLKLDKATDFLGRNRDGAGGKADFQGCSEFNPLRLFSAAEAKEFDKSSDKTKRNQENAPNRRVMILLFAPGRKVNPQVWPCPRASEGVAACKKRFFPDADKRRSFQESRREFAKTKDTFACRFYQLISDDSPCENIGPIPPLLDEVGPVIVQSPEPDREQPVAAAPPPAPEAAQASAPAQASSPTTSTKSLFAGPSAAPDSAAAADTSESPALVGPDFGFVMVRKDTTAPRQAFRLRVDKPFDGKGTLTLAPAGKIKFFRPGKGELKFAGGDNEFSGAELSKPEGVLLFGEGVTASAKKDDVLLTLALSGGTKKKKPPATMKLTCVELVLDICDPPPPGKAPVPLPAPDKRSKGAKVFAQGEGLKSRRAVLIVRKPKPATLDTELMLHTLSGRVDTFSQQVPAKGQTALSGVIKIKTSSIPAAGKSFFVEGKFPSKKDAEETYHLGIATKAIGTLLTDGVALTVIEQNWKGKLFYDRTWDHDTSANIAAVKEFLPMAKVELHGQAPGEAKPGLIATTFLDEDGKFEFQKVPELEKAFFRILLEHKDNKVVRLRGQVVKGSSTPVNLPDFKIKAGQTVSFDHAIDPAKFVGKRGDVDFGDFKIGTVPFTHYCDAYKSVWFGHKRLLELTEKEADAPLCLVNVPEPTDSTSMIRGSEMFLLVSDLQDRDVILHEYGHFIGEKFLSGGLTHPGYRFNDEPAPGNHGPGNHPHLAEHYESAWVEGHATFLSCALRNKSTYRDGHEGPAGTGGFTQDLAGNGSNFGAHNEASVQEALWQIHKVHGINFKKGFWTAFTATPRPETIFGFFDNWKAKGCPDIAKVVQAFKSRNMEFGYRYPSGGDRFTAVAAPKSFDSAKKEFRTVDELFTNFGNAAGDNSGTLADYRIEFYNRNKEFNAGSLGAGSKATVDASNNLTITINVAAGRKYIVPRRFKVQP